MTSAVSFSPNLIHLVTNNIFPFRGRRSKLFGWITWQRGRLLQRSQIDGIGGGGLRPGDLDPPPIGSGITPRPSHPLLWAEVPRGRGVGGRSFRPGSAARPVPAPTASAAVMTPQASHPIEGRRKGRAPEGGSARSSRDRWEVKPNCYK